MTQINWKGNDHSGAFVERSLRQLESYFDRIKSPTAKMAILQKYVWIWQIKSSIAKMEKDNEQLAQLKKEVAQLKELAGIAQANVISQ